jgi:hypothetical protein
MFFDGREKTGRREKGANRVPPLENGGARRLPAQISDQE